MERNVAGEIVRLIKKSLNISEDGVFRGLLSSDNFWNSLFTTRKWKPLTDIYQIIHKGFTNFYNVDLVKLSIGYIGTTWGILFGSDITTNDYGFIDKKTDGLNILFKDNLDVETNVIVKSDGIYINGVKFVEDDGNIYGLYR